LETPWTTQLHGRCRGVGTDPKAVFLICLHRHRSSGFHPLPKGMNLIGPARGCQRLVQSLVLGAGLEGWTGDMPSPRQGVMAEKWIGASCWRP
jgi:hypothetical protein